MPGPFAEPRCRWPERWRRAEERVGPMSKRRSVPKSKDRVIAPEPAGTSWQSRPFPIVGVGASAGGLEAFTQLLGALPTNTGMAFVLIQHLDPTHTSFLAEALAKATRMPVHQAEEGQRVEPNHVYAIPPNAELGILHGALTLLPRHDEA